MTEHKARLTIPGSATISLPIRSATLGRPVIDISALMSSYEVCTFDTGLASTAVCESKITYIDGKNGILLYRGLNIAELSAKSNYLEVCYLLLNNQLPNLAQMQTFARKVQQHASVDEKLITFIGGFPRNAHPMALMCSVMGGLAAFYTPLDVLKPIDRSTAALMIIAKMPILASMSYRHAEAHPFIPPKKNYSYAENFLYMMFGKSDHPEIHLDPVVVKAVERIFILHADHEQNASTLSVRTTASSKSNPFACISAGIATLWGSAHGGANEAVITMLEDIGDASNIQAYLRKATDKNDSFKLMGFGHRIYQACDPRAVIMRDTCHELLAHLHLENDKLFDLALQLENTAMQNEYFVKNNLYPNIDFYSGIALRAIGIPKRMFTAIFAAARSIGWIAHWEEALSGSKIRINRPRQLYTGLRKREHVPLKSRE